MTLLIVQLVILKHSTLFNFDTDGFVIKNKSCCKSDHRHDHALFKYSIYMIRNLKIYSLDWILFYQPVRCQGCHNPSPSSYLAIVRILTSSNVNLAPSKHSSDIFELYYFSFTRTEGKSKVEKYFSLKLTIKEVGLQVHSCQAFLVILF